MVMKVTVRSPMHETDRPVEPAIEVSGLTYRYGDRVAVNDLSLSIHAGELFACLGPNGGGKTTLFRVLSTLVPIQTGAATIFGDDLRRQVSRVRTQIGVVFQAPSIDKKLTVAENIRYQAALYGLGPRQIEQREAELLAQLGLTDRRNDYVESLSGGLRRRAELAKGMIHQPRLLLMDEPSTGLDPGARNDLWTYLTRIRDQHGVTIVLTTHLLDEADKADRIAIMHHGQLVALDAPHALKSELGGDTITIDTECPAALAEEIRAKFAITANVVDNAVRLEQTDGHQWVPRLVDAFSGQINAIRLGRPTLEDVFIQRTGHTFWNAAATTHE
jgi:ABC-2 type transport system ATP-binding protein